MRENLIMLEIERKMVVDREEKRLEKLKPVDGAGWIFANERLEIAALRLEQVRRRRGA